MTLLGPGAGALCALASAFTWAINGALVQTLSPRFKSATLNALRSSVAGLLLLAWIMLSGGIGALLTISPRALGSLAVSIVMAIAIGDTVFFESTRYLGLGRAMTISMTYPLIAALLAALLLGEPFTLRVAAGSLLTLSGLALIVTGRQGDGKRQKRFWLGFGTATLASIGWAVSAIFLKPPLQEVDAATAQAIRLPLAALMLWATPWTRGVGEELRRSGRTERRQLMALGALTAVSSVTFVSGMKYAGVAVATVLSSTAPMFAIPLGLLFLGERLTPVTIVGAAVTLAGITVLAL